MNLKANDPLFMCPKSFQKRIRVALSALFVLPYYLFAAGFGFYGSLGYGGGEYTNNDPDRPDLANLSYGKARVGGGFVYDNGPASQSVFGYRLNLGAEGIIDNVEDLNTTGTYSFYGVRINWLNDFGFALVRTPNLRWWLGPQLGLFYLDESDGNGSAISSLDFGLGAATGINFNMPHNFTIGLDLALRYIPEIATRSLRSSLDNYDASYIGNGVECGLTVSFMIRGRNVYYHRHRW